MEFPKIFKPKGTPEKPAVSDENKAEALKDIAEMEKLIEDIENTRDKLRKAMDEKDAASQKVLTPKLKEALRIAKVLQKKMEGKTSSIISAEYSYKDEKGKETTETIELDFEAELSSLTDFYKKHSIDLPSDFAEQMRDVWEKNIGAIEEAIREKGFNKVLFIPEKLSALKALEEKMTEGYKEDFEKKNPGKIGNETYWGGEKADSITENKTEARIVLVHDAPGLASQPELKKTLGKKYGGEKEKDNRAEDFIKQGETLTLSEYLILQRDIFEKTGIHLDSEKTSEGYIYWTWLPGSQIKKESGGSRVVRANWSPGGGQLYVRAYDAGSSRPGLGCRLSRSFF